MSPVQAHLSPFSAPLESSQPELGCGSVSVSPCSCPPTIDTPSSVPGLLTEPAPHDAPASGMYGRVVRAAAPPLALVELWYAQYWVPNPDGRIPCGIATTYAALAV